MHTLKRLSVAAATTITLSGCAIGWERPNTTQNEFAQDSYACQQEAAQSYPVALRQRVVSQGYQQPAYTNCQRFGTQTSCTTTGGQAVAPTTVSEDANQTNRSLHASSCLRAKGYTFRMGAR